jgi:hypothetical protein
MTEQAILTRLLVRHSYHPKFQRFLNPNINITVAKCEKNRLSEDERFFLINTVAKDFKENPRHGKISIVALNDFYSSGNDVIKLISIVENKLSQEVGDNNLHLLIIDYIQVLARDTCRYSNASDQYKMVGDLARYLKELSLLYGNRGLSIIALSQLNRRSYEDVKNKIRKNHRSTGKYDDLYDLSCFAESSELANAADVAIALYTDDNLKKVHKAMVQLLKNRNGETIETPFEVSALPQYSYFGDFSVPGDDGGYLQELVNELLGI